MLAESVANASLYWSGSWFDVGPTHGDRHTVASPRVCAGVWVGVGRRRVEWIYMCVYTGRSASVCGSPL